MQHPIWQGLLLNYRHLESNTVVVDDEELPGKILEQLIVQEPSLNLLQIFTDPIEALKYINSGEEEMDIIFLDIMMPKFTGFDLIQAIKPTSHIILISSDKNYALKAFEFPKVADYLLKPIKKERFLKAISKVSARSNNLKKTEEASSNKEDELYINTDKRLVKVNIPDINSIEAKGNFIYIRTLSENYMVYSSLKKIEEKWLDNQNRSCKDFKNQWPDYESDNAFDEVKYCLEVRERCSNLDPPRLGEFSCILEVREDLGYTHLSGENILSPKEILQKPFTQAYRGIEHDCTHCVLRAIKPDSRTPYCCNFGLVLSSA